jgi:hypothetical protein
MVQDPPFYFPPISAGYGVAWLKNMAVRHVVSIHIGPKSRLAVQANHWCSQLQSLLISTGKPFVLEAASIIDYSSRDSAAQAAGQRRDGAGYASGSFRESTLPESHR